MKTKKELRKLVPIRVQSIRDRAEPYDIDFNAIAKRIARFENVEEFTSWKNCYLNTLLGEIIERVGGNNYRYIRDNLSYILNTWALY